MNTGNCGPSRCRRLAASSGVERLKDSGGKKIVLLKVKHFCKSYHQDSLGALLLLLLFLFPEPEGLQNLGTVLGAKGIVS